MDEPLKIFSIEHYNDTPYHEGLTVYHTDNEGENNRGYDNEIIDLVEDWMFEKGILGIYVRPFYLSLDDYDKTHSNVTPSNNLIKNRAKTDDEKDGGDGFLDESIYIGKNNDFIFYLEDTEIENYQDEIVGLEMLQDYYDEKYHPIVYDSSKVNFCTKCRSYCYDFYCPTHASNLNLVNIE